MMGFPPWMGERTTVAIDPNMTPNTHFNTYKEGLDLEVLRQYCMEHGEVRTFLRGETLEEGGTARLTSVSWRVPGRVFFRPL